MFPFTECGSGGNVKISQRKYISVAKEAVFNATKAKVDSQEVRNKFITSRPKTYVGFIDSNAYPATRGNRS